MTISRTFNDPKSAAPFLIGERLLSSQENEVFASLRKLDSIVTQHTLRNFQPSVQLTTAVGLRPVAAYDASLGLWAIAWLEAGAVKINTTSNQISLVSRTVPASAAKPLTAASSGAGSFVIGLDATGGATASKILQSTDGFTWTLRTIGSADTKSVRGLVWDQAHSTYIAIVSSDTASSVEIFTSPTGVTWTSRTVPAPVSTRAWPYTSAGTGSLAISNATSSDGGVTWVARTGPLASATASVTYNPGLDAFLWAQCATGTAGGYTSPDGITWTIAAAFSSYSGQRSIMCIGAAYTVVGAQFSSGVQVFYSYDAIVPTAWARSAEFRTGTVAISSACASDRQLMIFTTDGATNTSLVASKFL